MAQLTSQTPKAVSLRRTWFDNSLLLIGVVTPMIGTLVAMVLLWQHYVFATDLILLLAFYLIGGLGVTVGYHRMLTHRAFETYAWLKATLIIFACQSLESNPISWVATHIHHHAASDEADDPHSPLRSFFHAHVGWLFRYAPDIKKYAGWLLKDATVIWTDKLWFVWYVLGLVICYLIGGWTGVIWGGLVRTFILHHVTWSINSICHVFGERPYKTGDESRNNWVMGVFGLGEGWHNNHHAFPRAAEHGLEWWQIDLSAYVIRLLEKTKLVWNVVRVTPEQKAKLRIND